MSEIKNRLQVTKDEVNQIQQYKSASTVYSCNSEIMNMLSSDDDFKMSNNVVTDNYNYITGIDDLDKTGTEQVKEESVEDRFYDIENPDDAHNLLWNLFERFKIVFENKDNCEEKALRLIIRWVFILYAADSGLIDKNILKKIFFKDNEAFEKGLDLKFKLLFRLVCSDGNLANKDIEQLNIKNYQKEKAKYIIGGDFFSKYSDIEVPVFDHETVKVIKDSYNALNWSELNPVIFSEVFVGILTQDELSSQGVYYTSEKNISKVIDPLFLDNLKKEFISLKEEWNQNKSTKLTQKLRTKLLKFQEKLGKIKILDPASGCGNFLIRAYSSLREIENKVLELFCDNQSFEVTNLEIKVTINNFYGIEIDERAVMISRLGMYIAEHKKFAESNLRGRTFFPLKAYSDRIVSANALKIDWETIVLKKELTYIIGNPPFIGARKMKGDNKEKSEEVSVIFDGVKNKGNLDYVCCWYKKAADMMTDTAIRAAFVSKNSITAGVQAIILWKLLFNEGVHIDFAYDTFSWTSDSNCNANVNCVIIGFSKVENNTPRLLFHNDEVKEVKTINGYLKDNMICFIESRKAPICNVPRISMGNQPIDNGNYLFSEKEYISFLKSEPSSKKFFKQWYGSEEFLHGVRRYCLWLGDCSEKEINKMPHCKKRVDNVREYRLGSTRKSTNKLADTPTRFQTENMPTDNYLVIPELSAGRREYIPMGYMSPKVLCSNRLRLMPNASLYHFGVLESSVHMTWVRFVCSTLGVSVDYSIQIVYNNFPWCDPTPEQKTKIEQTAQAILDARVLYTDKSLASLYDPNKMPIKLRKAHKENDAAVMELYGIASDVSESGIVEKLFEMYAEIVEKL